MHEVPITSITNGIHTKTWMAPEFSALYDKYLGDWEEHLTEPDFWRGVIDIPDAQLWETHQKLKLRLVEFVRERVRTRRERIGESPESIRNVNRILDPEILTIGFARRFATYKRGALLFSDKERLQTSAQRHDASGPIHFRRQSASARRRRQGAHPGSLQVQPRSRHSKTASCFWKITTATSRAASCRVSIFG